MAIEPKSYPQILDNVPHVIMRLTFISNNWNIIYINKAIERYGYQVEDFDDGKTTWTDLLHPDDRVVALKLSGDYMANNIDDFKLQYRILTKNGASIYITEYSHVNRNPDGSQATIDSFLFENLQTRTSDNSQNDIIAARHHALNDILLTVQDASSDPENAIQYILDRTGAFLDCSRALLFKDSSDHKTCKVVYEWLNNGITSIKDLDYAVTYSTEMPEIYIALQDTGVLLVNAGEIPENCKEEFEAEGLVSSAIFAVYQYGDHYGFVCFDDCIVERRWDDDTANFLKVVANLLSNSVMHLQSVHYMREYEDKIKSLAFRDYLTNLPNHYPYDSDLGDLIISASGAGSPGYAIMIGLNDGNTIFNSHGIMTADKVSKTIASGLEDGVAQFLGERGVLYRLADCLFAVLVQPGPAEPVRGLAEEISRLGRIPWHTASGDYECRLNVAAMPIGVKNVDPVKINHLLDEAMVQSSSQPDHSLVFFPEEP